MQNCASCRYFEDFKDGRGACHRIARSDVTKDTAYICGGHDDEAFLAVAPEFGCVLHEAGASWTEGQK